ncbi:AraC family transcriptional regulator [Amycolatopsis carbonis]|uniref:AraC family transcriptional regulator n=1 Tax=Amycolatopsis carbonis TaxID=715471 RepID=A0A9Y2MVS8_9PSEU|nr:AraC family transcriptional regulator [Amycolatopsis sp. 2-15]WIX83200.1 AraC family transcriptional regulator [Amycolatopsis sp. 2-15]
MDHTAAKTDPAPRVEGDDSGRWSLRQLCRATGFEVFRENLNSVFYPAKVEVREHAAPVLPSSHLSAAELKHLTVGYVCFGTETSVDPGALGAYHVNIPTFGAIESHCGPRGMIATPGHAAVFTPSEHTYLPRWAADAEQICVKISTRALEAELEGLLGHPVGTSVGFDLDFSLTSGAGRSWLSTVKLLLSELADPESLVHRSERHREHLESMVVDGLVLAHLHNYSAELYEPRPPARPRTIKRVLDVLDAEPERSWSLADLARHAGVSGRRVQQGFQEHLGMTPMTYLRRVRLERARQDLRASSGSVSDIANRWGFSNLGRFSRAYREQFGETPSATLRNAR